MQARTYSSFSRRLVMKGALAAMLTSSAACSCLFRRDVTAVCSNAPKVSHLCGALTIDAHCHVFNGTDLQIEKFLSQVAIRQRGITGRAVKALSSLLENLAWDIAPNGDEELNKLGEIAATLQTCTAEGFDKNIRDLKQDGYTRGLRQLVSAMDRTPEFVSLREKARSEFFVALPSSEDALRAEAIAVIKSLPERIEDRRAESAPPTDVYDARLLPKGSAVAGLIEFVLQNFQYRYVSVHDYLNTYNRPGERVVDLLLPSLVDYDFWLREGNPSRTSLRTQVELMRQMAIVTGGRVHAFVPFDPLRQVAFELGHAAEDSLGLVQEAVQEHGAIGVKLYPPMGFAPLGNISKDGSRFWKRDWLPAWTQAPDLGQRLDVAMRQVLDWCQAEQVPVMAHTSESNGPAEDFEKMTGPQYWELALREFPRLRVSFGHFGASLLVQDGPTRAADFAVLMNADTAGPGVHAYADAGYFVEVLSREPQLLSQLRSLYEKTVDKGDASLANRFMYGTDWSMTLTEGVVKGYLSDFETLFTELEASGPFRAQRISDLSSRFFGANAARWVGLRSGDSARKRLDRFYAERGMSKPDWAVKLDRADEYRTCGINQSEQG